MTIGFHIGAATNVGVKRDANQDSFVLAGDIAVVADGMGGHRGGEVASSLAAREVIARFDRRDLDLLVDAVQHANTRILDAAAANPQLHGMGTTIVALARIDVGSGDMLGVVNVGDSRMYRLTGTVLEQLTIDHSLVEALVREGRLTPEEALTHPQRNIVTRALGVVDDVEVDTFHFIPKVGDRYLLCSDGLFDEISAHEIATLLDTYADPQECVEALIVAANTSGGRDNITAVLVDIVEVEGAALPLRTSFFASEEAIAHPAGLDAGSPDMGSPDMGSAGDLSATSTAPSPGEADRSEAADDSGRRQRWSWRR